jgi:hypothetical protein
MADPANQAQRNALKATGVSPMTTAKPHKEGAPPQGDNRPLSPEENQLLQAFFATAKEQKNLVPGLGLGDTAYDPVAGINQYNAEKADRKRRVAYAMDRVGLGHNETMDRADMSPMQAIMMSRLRR